MILFSFVAATFATSSPRLIHNLYAPERHISISEIRTHLPAVHEERHISAYPKVECIFDDNCKTELNPNTGDFETHFGEVHDHEERHNGLISPDEVEVEKFYDTETGTNKIVVTMPGKPKEIISHHEVARPIETQSLVRESVHYPVEERVAIGHDIGHEIVSPSSEFLSRSYRALKSAHELSHLHR